MKHMLALVIAVTLMIVILVAYAAANRSVETSLQAQGDITPPILVRLNFNPATIDTSQGPQAITATARFTDDLSGFSYANLAFTKPGTTQYHYFHFNISNGVNGTVLDGIYTRTLTLPQYAAEGRWVIAQVDWGDQVGNTFGAVEGHEGWENYQHYHFINRTDDAATPAPIPTDTAVPTGTPTSTPTEIPAPTETPTLVPTAPPPNMAHLPIIRR